MKHDLSEREKAAARRLIEFLQAILDGKDVQFTVNGHDQPCDWRDPRGGDFLSNGADFRIIEPPKRRPDTMKPASTEVT